MKTILHDYLDCFENDDDRAQAASELYDWICELEQSPEASLDDTYSLTLKEHDEGAILQIVKKG